MSDKQSMTIDQVRQERRLLAQQIFEAVEAFNNKTGLTVEYVQLVNVDINTLGEVGRQVLTDVEIELNI
ncbi:hypothetical protein [Pseudomonas syringae]|uniref:Uncharacterized protein n=1 Tax=Pseudomonas syringae pv. solidagae TaxID=264458 RepID=A0A0N8SRS9_PSESX|nr:hypothetical protein [Pseudomonas syringae]KPY52840.1 Uncharacterized protein ALO46_00037 [Pseudomonas syringae pv. solidagae]RMT29879.1 hypothetical protein ALP49_00504 [Pseudomonas syringae pv. solidagae]RMT48342.1 hypothetical protein ALP48_00120 [Pseudomonas syringae pv. solidagae]